jgi:large subunit ribosomal protein L3
MNQHPGVVGRKIGMTQVFEEDGTVVPCTVVQASPVVVGKRTKEKDGYDTLMLGIEPAKEKHTAKAQLGFFKKASVDPLRIVREFRCDADYAAKFEIGHKLTLDEVFQAGQFVDVQALSRGRGFTGVMVRYNFKGAVRSHGAHEYKRHGGSIGTNMTPGRVLPGRKMPGQHGNKTCSVLSQRVIKILAEDNLILIRGGIPGSRNGLVVVRGATRRAGGAV